MCYLANNHVEGVNPNKDNLKNKVVEPLIRIKCFLKEAEPKI